MLVTSWLHATAWLLATALAVVSGGLVATAQEPVPGPTAVPTASGETATGVAASPEFISSDWELQDLDWEQLRYNGRALLPEHTEGLQDADGVPMRIYRKRDGQVYNPTVLAEQGMMRLDAWRRTSKAVHLEQARKIASVLDEIADEGELRRWQPHPYARFGYEPGWVNANSQGLVLSFFSRLYALEGDERDLATARKLFAAYGQFSDKERWFSDVVDGYLWFEHFPDSFRGQVLNAHINALAGLYDFWKITGSEEARRYLLGGITTVRDNLERFRRPGELSMYSLTTDFRSPHYNRTHVKQLRFLARMTGDEWFMQQAGNLAEDQRIWRKQAGEDP